MSTTIQVRYLTKCFKGVTFKHQPVPRFGFMQLAPGQGADGYGRKIATDWKALVNGRWCRVYCCCYSNSGSLYVSIKAGRFYVLDSDIPR